MNASAPDRHDSLTIHLHWLSAFLVAGLWLLGQFIDDFDKGAPRIAARSVHILAGMALMAVVAVRLARRAGGKVAHLGDSDPLVLWGHRALYALLVLTVVLGLANALLRGDSLFGAVQLPRLAPEGSELRSLGEDLHALAANVLAGLALAHAGFALYHHHVRKDGTLLRMLPQRAIRK
jgi:cytochrome b561